MHTEAAKWLLTTVVWEVQGSICRIYQFYSKKHWLSSHDNLNLLYLLCCCCSILQFVFFFIRFCLLYERGTMSLCWGSLWKDGRITNLWLGGSHGSSIISTVILLPEGRYLDFMKLVWCASVIWFVSCISYIIIDNIIISFLCCFLHIFVLLVIYFCFCWQ